MLQRDPAHNDRKHRGRDGGVQNCFHLSSNPFIDPTARCPLPAVCEGTFFPRFLVWWRPGRNKELPGGHLETMIVGYCRPTQALPSPGNGRRHVLCAAAQALDQKHRTYPELRRARRCKLVVFGVAWGTNQPQHADVPTFPWEGNGAPAGALARGGGSAGACAAMDSPRRPVSSAARACVLVA